MQLIHLKSSDIKYPRLIQLPLCELHGIGSAEMTRRAFVFIGEQYNGLGTKLGTVFGTMGAKVGTIKLESCVASVENRIKTKWRRTQVVRERSAKPLCSGSNPLGASMTRKKSNVISKIIIG